MIIPRPTHYDPTVVVGIEEVSTTYSEKRNAWVKWYLDGVPPWKCHKCQATMHGRMEYCVFCKFALKVNTPRLHLDPPPRHP